MILFGSVKTKKDIKINAKKEISENKVLTNWNTFLVDDKYKSNFTYCMSIMLSTAFTKALRTDAAT